MMYTIQVCGSGAREHQLVRSYSGEGRQVIVTPGNDGMKVDGAIVVPGTDLKDPQSFLRVAQEYKPNLVDVAQDDAIAGGTGDLLRKNGFRVFSPTAQAARIESDKEETRNFCARHGIPIPENQAFDHGDESSKEFARGLIQKFGSAYFKAAYLDAGKGVKGASNEAEVNAAYEHMQARPEAAKRFLIEQGLVGEEFSGYYLVSGNQFRSLGYGQDNKAEFNLGRGDMTGGMSSHAPALVTIGLEDRIENQIIKPCVEGLAEEGRPFTGILYLGGIVDEQGNIYVIEFNCRWGDPENHVIMPGLLNDYLELVNAAIDGNLDKVEIKHDNIPRVCVIGATDPYPAKYDKGKKIWIAEDLVPEGVHFLSAAMKEEGDHNVTAGGRVISSVGKGRHIGDYVGASVRAHQGMAAVFFDENLKKQTTDGGINDVLRQLNS